MVVRGNVVLACGAFGPDFVVLEKVDVAREPGVHEGVRRDGRSRRRKEREDLRDHDERSDLRVAELARAHEG